MVIDTAVRTSSDPLLAAVRSQSDQVARVQLGVLTAVLDWAAAHPASEQDATVLVDPTTEPALHLAGPGAPMVPEYAALDLALSLGMSTDAGLTYLGRALELRYRLPRLFDRVARLEVPVWKAFRVADLTKTLPIAGATFVDQMVAPFLSTCSWAQIERTVESARAQFDPAEAERLRAEAAEHRHADVHLDAARVAGTTVEVSATLDVTDALDLEAALRDGAQTLARLGSSEPLDVRRSQALGEMARHQLALDLDTSGTGRGVTVYVHLNGDDATGTLDNTQNPVLLDQVRQWCQTAGTKVAIKPVIDLTTRTSTAAYEPTAAIREHVTVRDRTCVFPRCHRRRVDLDHMHPHALGGETSTDNLAMLCRRHHRAKTHSGWTYAMVEPGLYHWTSPTHATYAVDRRPPRRRRP